MTKNLLAIGFLLAAGTAFGQITGYVLQPSSLQGPLDFTWADWTNTPDLNEPGFMVQGFAEIVSDGTAADSLGCETLVNDLAGKFAVVYRADCEFGVKALNAEQAGAIGVVIVNNIGGTLGMAAGSVGDQVTIPVIMISTPAGAALRNEILAGNVELLLANFSGQFNHNLSINSSGVLAPPAAGVVGLLAQDGNELSVDLGSWIKSNGNVANTSARLLTTVTFNGDTIYEEESAAATINPGDSVWFSVPTWSQASYPPGRYTVTYTAVSDEVDGFEGDNRLGMGMFVGDIFTYAQGSASTGVPNSSTFGTVENPDNFTTCIHFTNTNAQRVAVTGMYLSGTTQTIDDPIVDELVEITVSLWSDPITSPFTLPSESGLLTLSQGLHIFGADERAIPLYVPFDLPVALESGDRYLFCAEAYGTAVQLGFNGTVTYDNHIENYEEPVSMLRNGTTWLNGFSNLDAVPSLGVVMIDASTIGIQELEDLKITPFPNPANDHIRIPLKGLAGNAVLEIFDLGGHQVSEQRVNIGSNELLTVNVANMSNGTYIFQMLLEDGRRSSFRVVVTK